MNEIEKGSSNPYSDLGYADAPEMQLKAQLVTALKNTIDNRALTLNETATRLKLSSEALLEILKGKFRSTDVATLRHYCALLGHDASATTKGQ